MDSRINITDFNYNQKKLIKGGGQMALKLRGPVVDGIFAEWLGENKSITSATVEKYLNDNPDSAEIHISTPGGNAFVGIEICNLLREHGNVEVTIKSHAYSAGAVIAAGAKKIKMYDNATMLVHCALTSVYGNAADLRKTAANLDAIDVGLVNTFKSRFKGTEEELKALMDEDRLLTAQEALDYGLIDEILDSSELDVDDNDEESTDNNEEGADNDEESTDNNEVENIENKIKDVINEQKIINKKYNFNKIKKTENVENKTEAKSFIFRKRGKLNEDK